MDVRLLMMICGAALTIFGGIQLARMIYQLTVMDAQARQLPHPRFWGIFNISGNNSSGNILLYLLGRRRFPIKDASSLDPQRVTDCKKQARLALVFHLLGAAILIGGFIWYFT